MNTIKVKTTQNIAVEYAIASIGDRILAYLIDAAVLLTWSFLGFMAIGLIMRQTGKPEFTTSSVIILAVMFLPMLFYSLLCEILMNGQTVGKKARDIKVIKLSGNAPSVGDYLLRWIFRLLEISLCYGIIAIITLAINGKGQRLGDLAAGTSIIRTKAFRQRTPFETKAEENYEVTYPEVNLLSDSDMALIRNLLYKALKYRNEALLAHVANRTKEVMGVTSDLPDETFLRTVIKDYHHVMAGSLVG
jgi:uncharacterized RDD family membrane protein YckC